MQCSITSILVAALLALQEEISKKMHKPGSGAAYTALPNSTRKSKITSEYHNVLSSLAEKRTVVLICMPGHVELGSKIS